MIHISFSKQIFFIVSLLVIICFPTYICFSTEESKSWYDLQHEQLEKQTRFFSCGPAALSTIIEALTKIKISERDIFDKLGEENKMSSLSDLIRITNSYPELSLSCKAYKTSAEKLYTSSFIPSLVNVNVEGYDHFVVFKGYDKKTDTVILADPAYGGAQIPGDLFKRWFYSTSFSRNYCSGESGAILYLWRSDD